MNKENLIGEAVEAAAFITNDEGYDVAVLRRVIANEVTNEQHTLLTDDEWQSLVNLINAAPALLSKLKELADYVRCEFASSEPLCQRAEEALALVARAALK